MRFERLFIPAFGPFTDLDLSFPANGVDLHVIYGSNEAGKSSLLRAFRDLLFGIHGQSPDNFIHDYKKLRIMGEIISRAGERLTFQRRKGNKNTLLDAAGNELPDNALIPFLGSVDQEYFSTMFGLGTRELREGAEELLRGKGDIGNALFSASIGGTPVQLVLEALIDESERLFKGRATANVSIRPCVNVYKDLLRKSRDAVVSPEVWEKTEKALAEAEKAKNKLESEIMEFTRDLEWITRCEDAIPTVGRLNEEMRKLEMLPPMPEVSSDFVERARDARKTVSKTQEEVERLTTHIAKLEALLAGCEPSQVLLAEAEAIDRLHQEIGVYRNRKISLTDLETELAGLEASLQAGMQNLGLNGSISELENLRLNSALRLSCEEAADDLQNALEEHKENIKKAAGLKTQIDTFETQLQALPETDLTNLRDALSIAAAATEANRTLSVSESEVKRLALELKERHRELMSAPEDLDATGSLAVPTKATIRRIGEGMEEIGRDIKTEESKILEGAKQIDALKAELGRLERLGELPTEQSLYEARKHRDCGWSFVLADWKGDGCKEEFMPGTPLEEAFPATIVKADNIADQLREQAEAVAQAEEKRFQIIQAEKQSQLAEGKIAELQGKLGESQASWKAAWLPCGISPQSPAEMEEWREVWIEFKNILRQLRTAEENFRQKNEQVNEATMRLAAVLSEPEERGFKLLSENALRQVQEGEQMSGRRIEIIGQCQALKIQLGIVEQNNTSLATAVEVATREWEEQGKMCGLPKGISPKSGLVLLQERNELLVKFDSWEKTSTTLRKMKDAVGLYEHTIKEKASALGAVGATIEDQENDLWTSLAAARTDQTRYEQLLSQIEEAKDALGESQISHIQAIQALDGLVRIGKLETVDALEPLLANLELRNNAQSQIETFRDTLSGLARGQSVDDFLTSIRAEDVEALPQRKNTFQSQKEEKEKELQAARDTVYVLKDQKQKLEAAGDAAANYRQQAESYAARLRQDASRFVQLRLAAHFLQTQIERFRKENQGPLLEKSGQIFKNITRGAFSGLGAEFNADDNPILVGLRPDQTSVSIEGMSDGSRDQLYLALRLAALDQYLEKHEPMPLIIDDLLITCDNDRAAAILPQLAILAQRTQIFLFTHHAHLVELCRNTLGDGVFLLHQLNLNLGAKDN